MAGRALRPVALFSPSFSFPQARTCMSRSLSRHVGLIPRERTGHGREMEAGIPRIPVPTPSLFSMLVTESPGKGRIAECPKSR